ncbi:hypothetical protein ACLQ2R_03325 [Streptosporangium sp. DT93]|uniref:hypothetical protein n=1 Tax=Streptosporangium sp. DT93 TaxID=3393428 RepID=UPI003CF7C276
MTQKEMWAAVKQIRYGHIPRTYLWQVAVQADVTDSSLRRLSYGTADERTVQRVAAWLARHTAPPR